jgi:hypothetical protein
MPRIARGPLDQYIASLRDGEAFYAKWVHSYLEDPQKPGDWNGPGTSPPSYPARWSEEHARGIALKVLRLYGEQEGWRNERKFETERQLSTLVGQAAKREASYDRLEAALKYGRNRRRARKPGGVAAERKRRARQAKIQARRADGRFR